MLLPDSQGSWWISDVTTTGELFGIPSGSDSTVVSGKKFTFDKNATIYTSYSATSSDGSDAYFVTENEKIYTLPASLLPGINLGFPDSIANTWMLIVNPNSDYWLIGKYKDLTLGLMGFSATGDMVITGQKGATQAFTVNGNNLNAEEYDINPDYNGYIIFQGYPVPIKCSGILKLFFARGVGLVYSDLNMEASTINTTQKITFTRKQELKKYHIN